MPQRKVLYHRVKTDSDYTLDVESVNSVASISLVYVFPETR